MHANSNEGCTLSVNHHEPLTSITLIATTAHLGFDLEEIGGNRGLNRN